MRLAQVMLVCSTNPSTVELTLHTTVESVNKLLQVVVEFYRYLAQLINRYIVRGQVWSA
jgi:predicted  nucleic acid-binding Zn ribbon protein